MPTFADVETWSAQHPADSLDDSVCKLSDYYFKCESTLHVSKEAVGRLLNVAPPMRDTPHIAQYTVEIVSQRGVSHPFGLFHRVSRKYRRDTPFEGGGGIAPPLCMLSKGEMLREGGGGIAPDWPC